MNVCLTGGGLGVVCEAIASTAGGAAAGEGGTSADAAR